MGIEQICGRLLPYESVVHHEVDVGVERLANLFSCPHVYILSGTSPVLLDIGDFGCLATGSIRSDHLHQYLNNPAIVGAEEGVQSLSRWLRLNFLRNVAPDNFAQLRKQNM